MVIFLRHKNIYDFPSLLCLLLLVYIIKLCSEKDYDIYKNKVYTHTSNNVLIEKSIYVFFMVITVFPIFWLYILLFTQLFYITTTIFCCYYYFDNSILIENELSTSLYKTSTIIRGFQY